MKVQLKDVYLSFGEKKVLERLNLTVVQGERIAIMGFSGVGKTSLIRVMAGLQKPDAGTVEGIPDGVSVVFQESRLIPQLSVLGNVLLPNKSLAQAEALKMLEEVGLGGEANAYPAALSGGMARRVDVVRAVAYPSSLLLLDEPFSGLDTELRERTARFILSRSQGRSVVAVTHDETEAALLKARIVDVGDLMG